MSDQNLKPLIFLHPLSKTLDKLREVMSEEAEAEGIEIHDVESIEEAAQLMPIIGQSLILGASPKQCAVLLQKNKRFIKKSETKVVMLATKAIPPRTLEKFMKLGLTECIVEPVNPKTLLYKVRLQLRAIITKSEESELELQRSQEKEEETEEAKEKKERRVEIDDDEQAIVQKRTSERINSNYEGKSSASTNEDSHNKSDSNYDESSINGHYKGGVASKEKEKADEKSDIEFEKESISEESAIQQSKDEEKKKKTRKSNYKEESMGGHYQGNVSEKKESHQKEEDEDLRAERDDIDEEKEDFGNLFEQQDKDKKEDEEEPLEDDSDLFKGVVEKVQEEEKELENKKAAEKEEKNGSHSEFQEEASGPLSGKSGRDVSRDGMGGLGSTDHINSGDNKGSAEKEKEIDGFLRGGTAQKEDKEEENKPRKKLSLDISTEDGEKPSLEAPVEKEKISKQKTESDIQAKKERSVQEKKEQIEKEKKKSDIRSEELKEKAVENKKSDKEVKKAPRKSSFQEEQDGAFAGSMSSTDTKKDNNNRSNAKSDVINTNYSSNNSTKHNDNDLGKEWEASDQRTGEFEKQSQLPKAEAVFEKAEEGDTLDYSQIKEQFAAIEYGSTPKEQNPYELEVAEAKVPTINKTIVSPNGELVRMDFEEVIEEDESELKIYEPDSKGLEHLVLVLDTYYKKAAPPSITFKKISSIAFDLHESDVVFYQVYNDKASVTFNGFINNRAKEPNRESFDHEQEYKESFQNYSDNKSIFSEEWKEIETSHIDFWKTCKVPTWSDPKFQTEENLFVFPFYMGTRLLGFVIVKPQSIVNEKDSSFIEILIESARGIYLTNKEKEQAKEKVKAQKGPSALKSLWGKIAG